MALGHVCPRLVGTITMPWSRAASAWDEGVGSQWPLDRAWPLWELEEVGCGELEMIDSGQRPPRWVLRRACGPE